MTLIDAIYIHDLGGKLLLQYFIDKLEVKHLNKFYFLLDERIKLKNTPPNFSFLKASEKNRIFFYSNTKTKFSKIFCFANVPPPRKTKIETFIYFHNDLILDTKKTKFSFKTKLIFSIKRFYIKRKNNKKYKWIVQTEYLKNKLADAIRIDTKNIHVLPFYFDSFENKNLIRISNSFIYVSGFLPHKNHLNLIKAFIKVSHIFKNKIFLNLTIKPEDFNSLMTNFQSIPSNLSINNFGHLNREQINIAYEENENLIFPSLKESFGLPLIEATLKGLNVICSNLDYVKDVVEPSFTFNPLEVDDISNSILKTLTLKEIKKPRLISYNKIDDIIKLLTSV